MKISVLGLGKTGTHLYYALKKAGYNTAKALTNSDVIFITTQDSKIKDAVQNILNEKITLINKTVFHTSGSLTSDELKQLKKAGAFTGSFHPVQTFDKKTNKYSGRFERIYIAFEGDTKAKRIAMAICKKLSAKFITISKKDKLFHHVCCVMISNLAVSLVESSVRISGTSDYEIYRPLLEQTIENINTNGIIHSLTGPVERGDTETVAAHLNKLKGNNRDIYKHLSINAVNIALNKKSINKSQSKLLLKTLNKDKS
jgi:predicted short-subunit dehydrogenase-like oxidoreductase (DUF2520 family)